MEQQSGEYCKWTTPFQISKSIHVNNEICSKKKCTNDTIHEICGNIICGLTCNEPTCKKCHYKH